MKPSPITGTLANITADSTPSGDLCAQLIELTSTFSGGTTVAEGAASPLRRFLVLFLQIRWLAAGLAVLFAGSAAAAEADAGAPEGTDADRDRLQQIEQE